jgi:hypothetical protein
MNVNRVAMNVVAVLVLAGGFLGYRLYESETRREAISKEFEAYKQDQIARLSSATSAPREDEDRVAQAIKKANETEQRLRAEELRRVAAEERLRQLEDPRRATEARETSGVREGPQQSSVDGQTPLEQPLSQDRTGEFPELGPTTRLPDSQGRTITVKTRIDALSAVQVPLARVHAGDQVTVRIRPAGQSHRKIQVVLGPAVRGRNGRFPESPVGVRGNAGKWIKDQDRFMISFDLMSMGGSRFKFNTDQGAILYISTDNHRSASQQASDAGGVSHYEIELLIHQHNRWGITPESVT